MPWSGYRLSSVMIFMVFQVSAGKVRHGYLLPVSYHFIVHDSLHISFDNSFVSVFNVASLNNLIIN
jgi:hypothetical protein